MRWEHKDDLPPLYSFQEEATGERYLETIVGDTGPEAAYGHCIAIEGDTAVDLRGRESCAADGKNLSIVPKSIADAFSDEFLAMLKVAKRAQKYDRRFVATVC